MTTAVTSAIIGVYIYVTHELTLPYITNDIHRRYSQSLCTDVRVKNQ